MRRKRKSISVSSREYDPLDVRSEAGTVHSSEEEDQDVRISYSVASRVEIPDTVPALTEIDIFDLLMLGVPIALAEILRLVSWSVQATHVDHLPLSRLLSCLLCREAVGLGLWKFVRAWLPFLLRLLPWEFLRCLWMCSTSPIFMIYSPPAVSHSAWAWSLGPGPAGWCG